MMKIGKISVRVDPLFYALVAVLSLINGNFNPLAALMWAIIIFFSILIHELGHALTAIAYGQSASIEFVGFGGLTKRHGPSISLFKEFILVLNGPLAGLVLAIVASFISTYFGSVMPPLANYFFKVTAFANIFWTLINLLPIQPLDGGHLLRITLTGLFGLKGTKVALFLSFIFAVTLALSFFYMGYLLLGSLIFMFAFEGFRAWKSSLNLTEKDKDETMRRLFKSAEKDFRKEHFDFALQKFYAIREQTGKGVIFQKATERIAEILSSQGRDQEAFDLLFPLAQRLDGPMQKMLQGMAFRLKRFDDAVKIGTKLYQIEPSVETAIVNALSSAMLGLATPAVGWIQCAIRDGLKDLKSLLDAKEFNAIRQDPAFQNLQRQQ